LVDENATKVLGRIRRQWFAKRKSIMATLKEVMTNEASVLMDSDAANKAPEANQAFWEIGSDLVGQAYVTAGRPAPGREDHPGPRLHLQARDGKRDRGLARIVARSRLRECPAAAGLDTQPRPHDAVLGRLGWAGTG